MVESSLELELAGAVRSKDFGVGARDAAVAAKQMAAVRFVDVEEERLALTMPEEHDYQWSSERMRLWVPQSVHEYQVSRSRNAG